MTTSDSISRESECRFRGGDGCGCAHKLSKQGPFTFRKWDCVRESVKWDGKPESTRWLLREVAR